MRQALTYLGIGVITLLAACKPDPEVVTPVSSDSQKWLDVTVPPGFPEIVYPTDNRPTEERVELGRLLFHDVRLSRDQSISCATCHIQEHAFAEPKAVSEGVDGTAGFRNSPSLANIAWHPRLFMDGGVPTLELQVLAPFDNHAEFDASITEVSDELRHDETLNRLAQKAYGREFDPYVMTRALAAFERTLISGNSKWDRYLNGNARALSDEEKAGMDLFFSPRTQCSTCHSDVLMTDFSFRNIGLYSDYADEGRQRVTTFEEDNGKFKVPSLRNVALTAPYMHDGSVESLQSVVAHYNGGGEDHPAKDSLIEPLNLSLTEQAQLVAFLEALTDETFVTNLDFAMQP